MSAEALLEVVKQQKQPKCPPVQKCIKSDDIHTGDTVYGKEVSPSSVNKEDEPGHHTASVRQG